MLLNLLFLGCVAFLPYPTALLSAAGDQVPATIFDAGSVAAAGLAEAAVWLYAIHIRELGRLRRRWLDLGARRAKSPDLLGVPGDAGDVLDDLADRPRLTSGGVQRLLVEAA